MPGESAIDKLLGKRDWKSLFLLMKHIPGGEYVAGHILREGNILAQARNRKANGLGVYHSLGVDYCGSFRDDNKDGEGCQRFFAGNGFDGFWRNNTPHGWGTFYPAENRCKEMTGFFDGYHYLGNYYQQKPSLLSRIGGLFIPRCGVLAKWARLGESNER